jgi:hypothetical protein
MRILVRSGVGVRDHGQVSRNKPNFRREAGACPANDDEGDKEQKRRESQRSINHSSG